MPTTVCVPGLLALLAMTSPAVALATPPCLAARVSNCGHRGAGSSGGGSAWPENTIESALAARDEGADFVEIDVMHSADGVLVLMHDDTVDRTTDGAGCVGALTVAELQDLDAAAGTELEGAGVVVPTLDEFLAAVPGGVNIELKRGSEPPCPAGDRDAVASDVLALIERHAGDRQLVLSSFDPVILARVRDLDDAAYLGLLASDAAFLDTAELAGFDALNLNHEAVDGAVVADVHARGLEVNAWTVNDAEVLWEMLELGVDQVITDDPALLAGQQRAWCEEAGLSMVCEAEPTPGDEEDEVEGCRGCSSGRGAPGGFLAVVVGLLAIARREKRSTETIIDVGFDRLGDGP